MKFLRVISLLIIFGFAGFAELAASPYKDMAEYITKKALQKNKSKVAVLAFQSLDGDHTNEGDIISEELVIELINKGKLSVVERKQVQKMLNEIQFSQTGAIDAATAKKIGNGVGADVLVIGNYTSLNARELKVFTKVVDTETFEVIGATQNIVLKTKAQNTPETQSSSSQDGGNLWTKMEIGILSGVMIPQGTFNTNYQISDTIGTNKITYNINGIQANPAVPIKLRINTWMDKIFGVGVDIGFSSMSYANQILQENSVYEKNYSTASTANRTYSVTDIDNFQIDSLYLGVNFLIRIPISPKFFPYVGIGYKLNLQTITQNGNITNLYTPISASASDPNATQEMGIEFGSTPNEGSLNAVLKLFTYMVGVEWYITDSLGILAEYQVIYYGKTIFLKTLSSSYSYVDTGLGASVNGPGTATLTISPFTVHTAHLGLLFRF